MNKRGCYIVEYLIFSGVLILLGVFSYLLRFDDKGELNIIIKVEYKEEKEE